MYALAARGEGPKPEVFAEVDKHTGMPGNSAVFGLFISMVWLMYFYGANLVPESWFGFFSFDSSELPIVTLYAMYLPIFINLIRKEKDFSFFNRYVTPTLSILCSVFMVYAAFASHGVRAVSGYLVVYAVIMAIGFFFMGNKHKAK
ncbi:MAG: amino acid permease, partial [Peptococcaceae bacterium]|jgi:APA family basic amino acid/polyamine antiporter|nr:amino acid permease [Peptococcaceae bacterium]